MKKISIIGAGTSGLAAGIRLQSQGFQCEIYEKNEAVGGRMYQIKEQGFTFDVGPTIVLMPKMYQELFEMSGVKSEDYIQMQLLEPMNTIHYPDSMALQISSNLPQFISQLESFSEKETAGYLAYLADVYDRYVRAKNVFLDISYRKPSEFYNFKTFHQLAKLRTLNNAYQSISSFVKEDKLRKALSFQTLYVGVSPFSGPSIYTIIPMIELLFGVWYIKGGMYQMAKAMERRFLELGGKIHLNRTVSEIVIEKGIAKGIKVSEQLIPSDIVLSNADFPWAMKNLIKERKNKGKYSDQKIDRMKYSSSAFIMYFGLSKKYQTTVHQIHFAKDFKKNIDQLFEGVIPEDPSYYLYSPTQIDLDLAPDGCEVLYVLVPVPSLHQTKLVWNNDAIQNLRRQILGRIKYIKGFEDIESHIIYEKIFTPETFRDLFNLQFGATFGLQPSFFQSLYFRPQATMKQVKNLYFVGSSNHPGAGVPIVLMSAKIVANEIMRDHV
ncbi:MAG: dehydrosqualene desaturase [Tenericutes bacterium GWC2_34_14]|nr:MAG: dehydrosqualene desaturase [Tenericutes bacterium GWA2_35_7]OHE30017.1 MAG: dehydrosqualene desaturase [Tenericutes bacterium GWC2_34_14]OHE34996.1 MAG: dehydrosqualene desaturase [Tenericutes bacterium GWE2_34_108]OHE37144.1 MAG: dehydrosqualene desaturase [Tenericutes bacterium GWF1_35_14]OHE39724.1 MAG: dehydrosqualene desaturase [Tenericutes bacterium GWF2_35_184]OHE44088.1 MAG: dehydrosqualene desaturase [Tenericutes bacterium RIFOXYA2_FULL_36_32]OHE44662.1 MAG: dehydrosqualene d